MMSASAGVLNRLGKIAVGRTLRSARVLQELLFVFERRQKRVWRPAAGVDACPTSLNRALGEQLLHRAAERVNLRQRGIDIGRDAQTFELRMHDAHSKDAVLVPQLVGQGTGLLALHR